MFARPTFRTVLGLLLVPAFAAAALAQYEIDWHTIDGGGVMFSTDSQGDFELSGTIGQHDAGPTGGAMTGGGFELVDGFWTLPSQVCTLLGDLNLDGEVDGDDVQLFINCLFSVDGSNCPCADFDGGGVSAGDVSLFVAALMQ